MKRLLNSVKTITRRELLGVTTSVLASFIINPVIALGKDELESETRVIVKYDKDNDSYGRSLYSWFGSSLDMSNTTEMSGATHYYYGNNLGIEMSCYTKGSSSKCDTYFSVELHRLTGSYYDVDEYVGSAAFKRNGFTKATWTNVGSGRYYFKFRKCPDGQSIHSDSVAMYSW